MQSYGDPLTSCSFERPGDLLARGRRRGRRRWPTDRECFLNVSVEAGDRYSVGADVSAAFMYNQLVGASGEAFYSCAVAQRTACAFLVACVHQPPRQQQRGVSHAHLGVEVERLRLGQLELVHVM